nr:response regulator [Desulfobaculum xiamenense]
MLVDDEAELVETLAERLELRGIDADYALSGEEALRLSRENIYDLAVVDMRMPGMSGLDIMKVISGEHPQMRFIFLTGHGSHDDCVAGREAGASAYLMKPVRLSVLLESIQAALDGREVEGDVC